MDPNSRDKKILIVDDDPDFSDIAASVLQEEGFETAVAANGREALEQLRREPGRTRLVLLDLMMPVMNGWEFRAEQLRDSQLASIPVVACSASRRAAEIGTEWLRKPTSLEEMVAMVRRICGPAPAPNA